MFYESAVPSSLEFKRLHFDKLFANQPYRLSDVTIYQVGDLFTRSGYHVEEHRQACHELTLVVSGKGSHSADGRAYAMERGDLLLEAEGHTHSSMADRMDPFRFYYIGFSFVQGQENAPCNQGINALLSSGVRLLHDDTCFAENCFKGIFTELVALKPNTAQMIECYVHQLLLHTARLAMGGMHAPAKTDLAQGNPIVYQVMRYIDEQYQHIDNLSHISKVMGYSYSYLAHLFSETVGMTMHKYVDEKRFNRAVELLRTTDTSVTSIAEELNYKSVHAFSKAFRERYGLSPTEYQAIYAER